ncbi:MAG: hypothetical protein ABFD50_04690 [Smithella sp.]
MFWITFPSGIVNLECNTYAQACTTFEWYERLGIAAKLINSAGDVLRQAEWKPAAEVIKKLW